MLKLREDLEKGEAHGGKSQSTFDQEADKAYESMQKQLVQEKQFTADKLKLQGDWVVGAKTAFNDYKNNANDVAAQTQNAFTDAFKGMEDVLTTFIRTGKLSFGSLVDTILADMARMQAKKFMSSLMGGTGGGSGWIGSLMSMGMSMLGGGGGVMAGMSDAGVIANGVSGAGGILGGAYANGGDPPLNVPSLVGENGPELFVPKQAGTVVPNDQLGGGGTTITYAPTIHIDSRADRAQVMQDVQNAVRAGNAQLVDDLKRRRMI
jgi:lambda family phage tail tape measure protein